MKLSKLERAELEAELKQINSLIIMLEMRRETILKQFGEVPVIPKAKKKDIQELLHAPLIPLA
jgi:hypothetical protein